MSPPRLQQRTWTPSEFAAAGLAPAPDRDETGEELGAPRQVPTGGTERINLVTMAEQVGIGAARVALDRIAEHFATAPTASGAPRPRTRGTAGTVALVMLSVAGIVVSSGLWIAHMAGGDRALIERLDQQDRRIKRLENAQQWNGWALTSIAKAVNADLPPKIEEEP